MLHHIEIYVSNLNASKTFWSSVLSILGYEMSDQWEDGFTLKDGEDAYLTFVQVLEKYSSNTFHRCNTGLNHLAFEVKDRESVDNLKLYCTQNNIRCLYEERYPFANGGNDYYALFVEDPDRIKVEFVAK